MPITYQGDREGGGAGNLFAGMKFFIHRQTPTYPTLVKEVKDNGGTTVPLEQNADIKIADHVKPLKAPMDSYSYRFIEDCVKEGTLKPLESYQINQSIQRGQPAHAGVAAKKPGGSRTKFSTADDHLLYRWVDHFEKKGAALGGNSIYNLLATNYPSNHTAQSWRHRWCHILSKVPKDQRPQDLSGEPLDTLTAEAKAKKAAQDPASTADDELPPPSTIRTRNDFSAADDEILLEYVRQKVREGDRLHLKGLNMYQDLGQEHPQHTAQSWKDRFTRKILPDYPEFRNIEASHISGRRRRSTASSSSPRLPRRGLVAETPARYKPVRASPSVEDRSDVGPAAQHNSAGASDADSGVEESEEEQDDEEDEEEETEEQFLASLKAFWESVIQHGGQVDEDWSCPVIGGREVPIFDLWTVVASLKGDPAERDWLKVAEELDFKWDECQTLPDELQATYDRLLGGYEDAINHIQNDMAIPSPDESAGYPDEDGQEIHDQNTQLIEPTDTSLDPGSSLPLAPPSRPMAKRPRTEDDYISSPKRRKTHRDEVPTTPDSVTGTTHLRGSSRNMDADEIDNVEDYAEDLEDVPASRGRNQVQEPETQDFGFDPATQSYHMQIEEFDTQYTFSPSQQLLEEHEASTPTREQYPDNALAPDDERDETPRATKPAAKRRSLPKGFARSPKSSEGTGSPRQPARPSPPSVPVHDTPEDTIERFVGLGYDRPIVIKALDAATWRPGTAGAVMEILRNGGPIPNAQMVWTSRDDEALRMATSEEPARDAKEERKRAKKMDKLVEKHTAEDVELRKRYLKVRADRLAQVQEMMEG